MMDRERFDALARLLAKTGSRRAAIGALVGVGILGQQPDALSKPGKNNTKHRGKDRKRRKKRGRGDQHGDSPPDARCCGAKACAAPEPGSTRSQCNFAGASFAGQDLNGSIFRAIDGRGANFNSTDNHGSVFADACLQGATFRGAALAGSTWGDACLIDADFLGADLGGDSATFGGAVFCRTRMPDGSIDNRDCDKAPACCEEVSGSPSPICTTVEDCPDRECETKTCRGRLCVYALVVNGPSPNGLCGGHCCAEGCCRNGGTSCTSDGIPRCCTPNCAGRQCGPAGDCGGDDECGTCPAGEECLEFQAQCFCGANPGCNASGANPNCCPGGSDGGGACTNVQTDRNNCGSCGAVCGAAQTCAHGVCTGTG